MIVSQPIQINFLDNKNQYYIAVFKNVSADGKMVDQLLLTMLYDFTLKFIKKMENFHSLVSDKRLWHRERHTDSKSDNRNFNHNYYFHFIVIMDIFQSE